MADNFQPSRAADLRHELSSDKKDRNFKAKKVALRKIVANMSLNSVEMLNLFPDVVNCLRMDDIEVKRLATLYLETYAKSRIDIATSALPFLVKDAKSDNPLMRSLALRTISAIPIQAFITETVKLCGVLAKDHDPLVRVAATYAMAKVWAHQPKAAENEGFLQVLNRMLNDKHPRVSATAVSCLLEIASATPSMTITIEHKTATYLINSLSQCNEWCQVYILRILQHFVPETEKQAADILQKVFPRTQHANTAVVIAAIRLTIYLLHFISNYETVIPHFVRSFHTPFSLLMSKPPQLQYIMLRNLYILIQSHPKLVMGLDAHHFFCRYNDPTYLRTSKIQVLDGLANDTNAEDIIKELCMCAADVDVDASRKAINAVARIAIKLPNHASVCIERLGHILQSGSGVPYITQESATALQLIIRKYPQYDYREFIMTLCECKNDIFDDLNAKVALLWILGQYPLDSIDLPDMLVDIISTFAEEDLKVQLAAITSAVKLFIAHPQSTQDVIPKIFEVAIEQGQDPDLRDRAFMYWRLVSRSPQSARGLICTGTEPSIDIHESDLPDDVLEELVHSLGYLSTLYLKAPSKMFRVRRPYQLPQSPALVPRNQYRLTESTAPSSPSLQYQQRAKPSAVPRPPPARRETGPNLDRTHSIMLHRQPLGNRQNSQFAAVPESPQLESPFGDQTEKLIDI